MDNSYYSALERHSAALRQLNRSIWQFLLLDNSYYSKDLSMS
ncbi:MAG: hypothetical protein SWX82_15550 [Cyanobacteriota bacterium]|nr:hypothetical protein [Cyanobacteriota bacterium]